LSFFDIFVKLADFRENCFTDVLEFLRFLDDIRHHPEAISK